MKISRVKRMRLFPFFIFAAAFLIRFYGIDSLPINHDEEGWAAGLLSKPYMPLLRLCTSNISYIMSYFTAVLLDFRAMDLSQFIAYLRLQPVFIGASTVLLLYFLVKQMYGVKEAIISSLLFCFLPWHIIYSRMACRVIWMPFLGCAIFLSLFKALRAQNKVSAGWWFLSACFFLAEALKGYESGILFIPMFFIVILFLSWEVKYPLRLYLKLIAILALVACIYPFIYKILSGGDKFWGEFYRGYHPNIFKGSVLFNLWSNLKNNFNVSIQYLFFQEPRFLYGQALKAPLLIHPAIFFIIFISLFFTIWRKSISDKVILIWIFLGFFGAIMGINSFEPRYMLIALPPLIILISRPIASIFNKMVAAKGVLKRRILLITGMLLFLGIITLEINQWVNYYHNAPFDFEECRQNSFGSQEAAQYLKGIPDIKDYNIIEGSRMTVEAYLNYYLISSGAIDRFYDFTVFGPKQEKTKKIYALWAPESHPADYWGGEHRFAYDYFRQSYPDTEAVKTIYYPNRLPAIYIFKVD